MRMPELDGAGLCRGLATHDADALARLVFLASPDSLEDHQTFLAETSVPVLTKPVALENLHSVVDRMIGQIVQPVVA